MSSNFKLHITPNFSEVIGENGQDTEETYAYFNKPFGLLHWFEYSGEKIKDDDIIILIDPDRVLTIPITLVRLMVSNVNVGEDESGGEGWDLVQAIDDEDMCSPNVMVDYTLPPVLHYCQAYKLGKHFFGKYRMPTDILSCESPLLSLPAKDVAKKYDYYIPPRGTDSQREKLDDYEVKENAFMLCALTRLVNEASLFYHSKNCEIPKDPEVVIDLWLKEKVLKNKYV